MVRQSLPCPRISNGRSVAAGLFIFNSLYGKTLCELTETPYMVIQIQGIDTITSTVIIIPLSFIVLLTIMILQKSCVYLTVIYIPPFLLHPLTRPRAGSLLLNGMLSGDEAPAINNGVR